MLIKLYEFQKVQTGTKEIFIPEEPFYCFQTGVRRAVRVVPIKSTIDMPWSEPLLKKGAITHLEFTAVYRSFKCRVEKFTISMTQISDSIGGINLSNPLQGYVDMLVEEDWFERDEERFNLDLESVITILRNI
jgi:hypothetical protein